MANLVLKNNTAANDVMLELNRGTNASWRMVNNSGTLYLKCNYTNTVGDYYDVFSLAYNTGNATLKGALSVGGALSVAGTTTLSSTVSVGNIMTFTNSTEANRKITSSSGAMYYSSQSTTYIDSGASSSIIFRPQGTEQARFNTTGNLVIKSTGAAAATIVGPGTAGTFYFPNTGGTFVTHDTRGTPVGDATYPVYIASTGRATEGSQFAGGTKVTLNGTAKGAATASFYAPTAAGTSGQLLVSSGEAPTWKNLSDIADSRYVNTSGDTMTGALTISSGQDLILQATSGSNDSGDIIYKDGSGVEIGRLWISNSTLNFRNSESTAAGVVLHTQNYASYLDGRYVNVSGDTMTGALNLANGTWNKAGDDAYFGGNNTGGAFCIKGINGATSLKMVSNSNSTYAMIKYNTTNECIDFVFS